MVVGLIGLLGAVGGDAAASHLDPNTSVPLGVAFAAGGVCVTAAFWIGSKLTKINDRLWSLETKMNSRPCFKEPDTCTNEK
jgi:hypothetical protein